MASGPKSPIVGVGIVFDAGDAGSGPNCGGLVVAGDYDAYVHANTHTHPQCHTYTHKHPHTALEFD